MPDRTHGEKRMEELARKGIHGRVLAFYDRCIRDMSAGADLAILDLGAGSGHVSLWLAAQDCVGSVVAYDKALKYMRELPKHPKIEKRSQGSNTALPFGSDEFDVVICRYVFHHFEQKAESLREVRRVLKPGGLLLLSDAVLPDHSKSVLNPLLHVREQNIGGYLTYHETLRALEDAGLCPVLWRPYTYSYESFAKLGYAVDSRALRVCARRPPRRGRTRIAQWLQPWDSSATTGATVLKGRLTPFACSISRPFRTLR